MNKRKNCRCGGTGWIEIKEKRKEKVPRKVGDGDEILLTDTIIEVPAVVPCPHCAARKSRDMKTLSIPDRFRDVHFDNFDSQMNSNLEKAKRTCIEYCENFNTKLEQNSLLLMGPPGLGKTHLAVSILKRICNERLIRARFFDFREILGSIRLSYANNRYGEDEKIFDEMKKCDLLVIDELGSEQITDWVMEVFHRVILPRYNQCLPTVFTTNYLDSMYLKSSNTKRINTLDALLENINETLEERIGHRLTSKLREMCQIVFFQGNDFRKYFTELAASPDDKKNAPAYKQTSLLMKKFAKLPPDKREELLLHAVRLYSTLALENAEAATVWLYGRKQKLLDSSIPLRQFIHIWKNQSTQ